MNKTGLVVIAVCAQLAAVGEIKETKLSGFSIEQEIVLPGSPVDVHRNAQEVVYRTSAGRRVL
jgi:hypothetical protein